MSLKNSIRWQIFLFRCRVISVRSAAAYKMAKVAISLNKKHLCPAILADFLVDHYGRIVERKRGLRMKVIFRFLAKAFSDVAWFFAELSGDVETQECDNGAIIKQVTYK